MSYAAKAILLLSRINRKSKQVDYEIQAMVGKNSFLLHEPHLKMYKKIKQGE